MSNAFGLSKVKHLIAISSCKGGVGKSTLAAQLACELASQGFKIGLLDADIYGPSLPTLFDLHQVTVYSNEFKMITPIEKNGLKLMSFGFLLGNAPAVMRGPIVTRYVQQLLFQTDWGELDYLLIDMPPGTGDVQLTITQSVRLTGALIITTHQALSLVDVARGILMFEKVNVPILGIVENMSYFICDACSKKHYLFGESHANTLSQRFGVPTLAQLPIDRHFSANVTAYQSTEAVQEMAKALLKSIEDINSSDRKPPEVKFDAQHIQIKFSDGKELVLNNRDVRLACQCALCVDELSGKKILNPAKIKIDIAPTAITPLGNYAIGIDFNDGHNSGIYPYTLLQQLG